MADEPSMLDSIIAQISAMRNRLPAIFTGDNLDNRTEVLAQTPLNPPEDIHDQTTSEDEGDVLVNEPEDLPDTATSKDDDGASVIEPERLSQIVSADEVPVPEPGDLLTMSGISMQSVAPVAPISDESDTASQISTVEESWIPLVSNLTGPLIQVIVEGHSFLISKHLLCRVSPVLERALCGSFREARENKIDLSERLDLFMIFNYWLYQPRSEYPLNVVEAGLARGVGASKEQRELAFLDIYLFADRLQIQNLGNAALTHLDKVIRPEGCPGRASVATICQAHQSLLESCGLWKYLIAIEKDASRCGMPCRPAEDYDHLPGPFIFEMLKGTEGDRKPYLQIANKRVDLVALEKRVRDNGGYRQVEQLRKWGVICSEMGLSLNHNHQNSMQLRHVYRRWVGPFDSKLTPQERQALEKQSARPIVKAFKQYSVAPAASRSAPTRAVTPTTAPAVTQ
ncbi:hypothetical protein KCU78_g12712, partial [Aureobasidium melanogenum]